MLKQRLMTAAIGLPLLLGLLIFAPASWVFVFFFLCVAISVFEIASMFLPALSAKIQKDASSPALSTGDQYWKWFCMATGCLIFSISTINFPGAERGGIILGMVLILIVGTFSAKSIDRAVVQMSGFFLSVCYGCLPWLSVWDLYLMSSYGSHILITLAVVMLSDTGAYFAGRAYGKTPLAQQLSPKKTWEGFAGGTLASFLGVQLMNGLYGFSIAPFWILTLIAIFGNIAGVLGDLIESAFKRFSGVKDSGTIFPGHGGFLDRADSLLIAAPIIWFIFYCYKGSL